MSSEPTVLNYMPLVVSSEFGKSALFIIPVKTISIYILKGKGKIGVHAYQNVKLDTQLIIP